MDPHRSLLKVWLCLTCMTELAGQVPASLVPRTGATRREWCPVCEAITPQRMEQ